MRSSQTSEPILDKRHICARSTSSELGQIRELLSLPLSQTPLDHFVLGVFPVGRTAAKNRYVLLHFTIDLICVHQPSLALLWQIWAGWFEMICALFLWGRDMADWDTELSAFLQPFLDKLGHKRRQMCPLYVSGLICPGDRKSIEPMAERFAPGRYDRLHHFISGGLWDAVSLETELARQADRIVGALDAFLVIDDTGLPKKGDHSVGVAPQYASMLGKRANCQTLVSGTLVRDEVHVPVGLRLFLPESRTSDTERMAKTGVPDAMRTSRTKPGDRS